MRAIFLVPFFVGFILLSGCVPASVSRIGPPRAPKKKDCEIIVLPPGEEPERPWVDIGAVLVENCQEYHVGLCRKWVTQKACELGGEIAYLPNPESPGDDFNNINYRVLVAVFAQGSDTLMTEGGCVEPTPAEKSSGEEPERCLE